MYYIIMYYISKLFEMRFCYTVVFTSNYAQIPRPIISVNSSFLRGQFAKVVKLENFFEFLQNSWAVIRTCARQTEQPSNLITMEYTKKKDTELLDLLRFSLQICISD